jgi:alpha-mannosidase
MKRCFWLLFLRIPFLWAGDVPQVVLVRSSHQDIAWMDTPEACRRQRAGMIRQVLAHMVEDPEACFTIETSQYLSEILADLPDQRDELLARSREGRLEWGATWNLGCF